LVLVSEENLPVLKMNFDGYECSSFNLIQSTGQELDARIMQMQIRVPKGLENLKSEDHIIESTAELEILDKSEFEIFVQNRATSRQIASDQLKLELNNKNLQLFYNSIKLTKDKNLVFGFYFSSQYYNFFDGEWSFQKDGLNALSFQAEFKDLNLRLRLLLSLQENLIRWNMFADGCELIELIDMSMQINLTEKYEKFFDLEGEQKFNSASEHVEQISLRNPNSGLVGLCTENYDLPAIVFEGIKGSRLELQNESFDVLGRIIIAKFTHSNTASGEIVFFDSSVTKTIFLEKKQKESAKNTMLGNDALKLSFDQNRISIYCDGIEITNGQGFHSGVYFKGRWYESTQLHKEIRKEENKIKVMIKRRIPKVDEFWEIIIDQEVIGWSVMLESAEELPEMYCKAGIILNSGYRQWAHSFDKGEFSDKGKFSYAEDLDNLNVIQLMARANKGESALPLVFLNRENTIDPRGIIIQGNENNSSLLFKFGMGKDIDNRKQEDLSERLYRKSEITEKNIHLKIGFKKNLL